MTQSISFDTTYTFKTLKNPAPLVTEIENVQWKITASGSKERSVLIGPKRRKRGYRIWLSVTASPSEETTFDTFIATLSNYSDTFTFVDHLGNSFTARFLAVPEKTYDDVNDVLVDFEVIEVLT